MKKTFYTLFLCFLFVFCPFLLMGCGQKTADLSQVNQPNAFRIIRQANPDDSIGLAYIFPVNTKILKEKGLLDGNLRTFRFYLSIYVNALAEQNRNRAEDGVIVGNAAYFEDVDGIGFTIKFDNLDAQKEFFGVEDDQDDDKNSQKTSGFFIKKQELSTIFPVSNVESANNLKYVCQVAMRSWAELNENVNVEDLLSIYDDSNFIYHFSSTQTALKSELCFDQSNFHHNVFIKTMDDIKNGDTNITFYASYPNTPVWYASALVVVILGILIAIILTKVHAKQKKQQ